MLNLLVIRKPLCDKSIFYTGFTILFSKEITAIFFTSLFLNSSSICSSQVVNRN